jgi:hypothetical protein
MKILLIILIPYLLINIVLHPNPPKEKGLRLKEMRVTENDLITEKSGSSTQRLAIVVGLNEYLDKNISKLSKARYDAKLFAKTLKEYGQFDQIITLTDDLDARGNEYPNKRNIDTKINVILNNADSDDFFLFYFSGHGVSDSNGRGYLLPTDADSEKINDDRYINETAVSVDWLTEKIKKKGIKRSILILDACRNVTSQGTKSAIVKNLKSDDYANSQISAVFYSTRSGYYSYEDLESDNGVFTKYLVEAMMGSADLGNSKGFKDNVITFSEVQEYVTRKVTEWSNKSEKTQVPYIKMNDEFTGTIPITAYEGEPIVVRAQKDKTAEALWRSALLPGWGQYHKEEPYKAFGFGIVTLGLVGGFVSSYANYQSSRSAYLGAGSTAQLVSFGTADSSTLGFLSYMNAQSARSQVESASGTVSLTGGLLLGVYLLNLLDAGTYRDVNRQISQYTGNEGWSVIQKKELYAGQIGIYNEMGYNWKF